MPKEVQSQKTEKKKRKFRISFMLHGFGMVRKPVFLLRILIVLNTYKNTPTPFRYRNKQIVVYDRLVSVFTLGKEREPGEDF